MGEGRVSVTRWDCLHRWAHLLNHFHPSSLVSVLGPLMRKKSMNRVSPIKPHRRRRRLFETLEVRQMLSAAPHSHDHDDHDHEEGVICAFPVTSPEANAASRAAISAAMAGDAKFPLNSIPKLNSFPGAAATIYLDFNGHLEADWGGIQNVLSQVFDLDGDVATFSQSELDTMREIFEYVAEDFAPFNINITTVEPKSFADRVAIRAVLGGDGAFIGSPGGVAFLDSFTNGASNTVYIFPDNLSGAGKQLAHVVSHEAGHAFGLEHQSLWVGTTKVAEYYAGPGDGRTPIMGLDGATRSIWWRGTSSLGANVIQDDMAVLLKAENGFGLRPDDHGNSVRRATKFAASEKTQFSFDGLITSIVDSDGFTFTTGGGLITLTAGVPDLINNLDLRLELHTSKGELYTNSGPNDEFGATISTTVPAGTYTLFVHSEGFDGDVGSYTVTGTILRPSSVLTAPRRLLAVPEGQAAVELTWQDRANNESGYFVERRVDGRGWVRIATLPANSKSYIDRSASAGVGYSYRVRAFNTDFSAISNVAALPRPAAPSKLSVVLRDPTRLQLRWQDNSVNEDKFVVQRSTNNGRTWSTIGSVRSNYETIIDRSVISRRLYVYRVAAVNDGVASAFSNSVKATAPDKLPLPSRSQLRALAMTATGAPVVLPEMDAALAGNANDGPALASTWTESQPAAWVSAAKRVQSYLVQPEPARLKAVQAALARYDLPVEAAQVVGAGKWKTAVDSVLADSDWSTSL